MEIHALIISTHDDLHSQVVKQEIEKLGGIAEIIDTAEFPEKLSIEYVNGNNAFLSIRNKTGKNYHISKDSGIWWRRPHGHNLSRALIHPKLHKFAEDECRQAFLGALSAFCCNFVNPIGASRQASVKLHHLELARKLGFKVPRTLVTNEPNIAKRFVEELKLRCVYKPFTGADFGFFETRSFASKQDVDELWRVEYCPMLIQEHIIGLKDVRVTVVGNRIFGASFDLSASQHGVDSRVERLPASEYKLAPEVQTKILKLMKLLELHYGAIDLRVNDEGELVFFEINPEGQYLWIEIDTGLQISRAVAELLIGSQKARKTLESKNTEQVYPDEL